MYVCIYLNRQTDRQTVRQTKFITHWNDTVYVLLSYMH